jgi:hypothetical protein
MTQCIIYNQDNGIPAVVMPTQEALDKWGIIAIAIKDVPAGKPFKIVDASELPQDIPQEAWVVDESGLTDGVGGESNEFPPEPEVIDEQTEGASDEPN